MRIIVIIFILLLSSFDCNSPAAPSQDPISNTGTATVLYPNGREIFRVGDTLTILCSADTSAFKRAMLYWTSNNGNRWDLITTGLAINLIEEGPQFKYLYIIPDSIGTPWSGIISTIGESCLIRITDYETMGTAHEDVSDNVFHVIKN